MHPHQFDRLLPGTLVFNKSQSVNEFYVVTAHYGSRITAVRAVDITNPEDWEIVRVKSPVLDDPMAPKIPNIPGY